MKMITVLLSLLVLCQPALTEEIDKAKWIELLNGGNTSLEKMHGKEFTVTGKLKIQGDRKKCVKALLLVDVFDGKKTQNISIPVDFGMPIFLTPDDIREARLNVKFNTVKVEDERLADDYDPPPHLKKTPVGFKVRSLGGGVTQTTTVFADDPALDKKQLEDARAKGKLVRILKYGMFLSTARLVKKNDPEPNVAKAENNETRPLPNPNAKPFAAGQERDDNQLKLKLCWCPPGKFLMGSPKEEPERVADEDQVEVTLSSGFWCSKFEVTQAEWQAITSVSFKELMAEHKVPDALVKSQSVKDPMCLVSHTEAMEFCSKLTDQERKAGRLPAEHVYRLPTEAEWEYACRAGTRTATAFGDSLSGKQANCVGGYNGGEKTAGRGMASQGGSFEPNAWGLHDMHGNVHEWCLDWRDTKLPGGKDPFVKASPFGLRVVRGAAWDRAATEGRSARRGFSAPTYRSATIGFRVVLGPDVK